MRHSTPFWSSQTAIFSSKFRQVSAARIGLFCGLLLLAANQPKATAAEAQITLSADPSDEEIGRLRYFPQRVLPVGESSAGTLTSGLRRMLGSSQQPGVSATANRALADTLRSLQQPADPRDTAAIETFLAANPASRWTPALRHELARRQFAKGMFPQALEGWDALWDQLKQSSDPGAVAIADEALGQLLEANIGLGKASRLTTLIGEQESRPGNGVLEAKIARAKQAVWLLKHKGAQNVMCGPLALYQILRYQGKAFTPIKLNAITDDYIATGITLTQIKTYSDGYNMGLMMARKSPGAAIPTPAIIHLTTGHYSTLLAESDGRYLLVDRPMQFQGEVTLAALDAQASGYFLIPKGELPPGWQAVSEEEGNGIFGRDGLHGQQPLGQSVTSNAVEIGGDTPAILGTGAPDIFGYGGSGHIGSGDGWGNMSSPANSKKDCGGMATYTFHPQVASIRVEDVPVGYAPPVGPAVFPKIAYNDLDDSKPVSSPAFTNVGRLWSLNWIAYVDHVSGSLYSGEQLTVHVSGGGIETSTYDSTNGYFGPNDRSFATVVRTATYTYTRTLPDGSREVYNTSDNGSSPTRVFLTQRIDPYGNIVSFAYDGSMRLTQVTDAIGQVTTLAYQAGDIWKVTRITDPFGRYATFTYNGANELASSTDVLGLTSSYVYDGSEFLTSLTTPYGTTTFLKVNGSNSWDRTVTVTDPQGDSERVQYVEPIDVPGNEPPLPATINVGGTNVSFIAETGRLQFRNSFYWSKKAMKEAPGDYSVAQNYRWFTDSNYLVTPIVESIKEPFEGRV